MTFRTADRIDEDNDGHQQSVYNFGSKTSMLSVGATEAKIDAGDPIIGNVKPGGELTVTNTDSAESIEVKLYNSEDDSDDWDTNPERFSQIGEAKTVAVETSETINWIGSYRALTITLNGSGVITTKVYATLRANGYDPDA